MPTLGAGSAPAVRQAGAWMLPAVGGILCPVPILVGPCEARRNYNQTALSGPG